MKILNRLKFKTQNNEEQASSDYNSGYEAAMQIMFDAIVDEMEKYTNSDNHELSDIAGERVVIYYTGGEDVVWETLRVIGLTPNYICIKNSVNQTEYIRLDKIIKIRVDDRI